MGWNGQREREDWLDCEADTQANLPGKFFFLADRVPNRDKHLAGWEAGAEEKMLLGLTRSKDGRDTK